MVTWAVGAVINVCGSILINGGTNVMKLGHDNRTALQADAAEIGGTVPPIRKIRAWQIGVGLFIFGNLLNFGSFAFAAQSLLAALGSVQFIANVVFGRLVLKEPVTRRILVATALIVAGCIVLVSFGNHDSETFTAKELQNFYHAPGYIAYLCVMFVAVIVSYSIYRHGNMRRKQRGLRMEEVAKLWQRLLPIFYSVFSALLGTQSVLFSKALSLLLRTTFSGKSQLSSWFVYVNLLAFIVAAAFWVTRLNTALRLFPAAVIVPIMQICWTLFSIINGMIYYQEYIGLNALKGSMFALGVLIVFVGVWVLTNREAPADQTPYTDLQDTVKDGLGLSSPERDSSMRRPSLDAENMGARNAQLGSVPEDDERFPLSPSRSSQHARSSRTTPADAHSDQAKRLSPGQLAQAAKHTQTAAQPQQQAKPHGPGPHHKRRSSLLSDLAEDFSISLADTRRQLIEVAEHPVPPYAWPGNTSRAASTTSGGSPRDMEMGKPAGAGAAAGNSAAGANPFGDGLPSAILTPLPERPTGGDGGPADEEPDVFGGRRFIEEDDPLSPTWTMNEDSGIGRPGSPHGEEQHPRGTALGKATKKGLRMLSPRGVTRTSPHGKEG